MRFPSAAPAQRGRCVMLEVRSANVARLSSTCILQLELGLGFNPSLTELCAMCDAKTARIYIDISFSIDNDM